MRVFTVLLSTALPFTFSLLIVSPVFSANPSLEKSTITSSDKSINHSHNGRIHAHILPLSGVKHFHKHSHNDRSHIHPYSPEIGFKHSHNTAKKRLAANSIKHNHGNRAHSHPLPNSGVKHQHRHKHGGRIHIHPLPVDGINHFHRIKPTPRSRPNKNKLPRNQSNNLEAQIAQLLSTTALKSSTSTSVDESIRLNQYEYADLIYKSSDEIVNKEMTDTKGVLHQHEGRSHTHALPKYGDKHYHKHAHHGRIHFHPTPSSNRQHTHKSINNKPTITATIQRINSKVKERQIQPRTRVNLKSASPRKPLSTQKSTKKKAPYKASQKPLKKPIKVRTKPVFKAQINSSNRQLEIGLRYQNGTGVKKNLQQAANWYRRSAEQGNAKAQFNLGSLYEHGSGVKKDLQQAIRWYRKAAIKGDVNAQVSLGNYYALGKGVTINIPEAKKWYKKAADQGDMRGQANLNDLISH